MRGQRRTDPQRGVLIRSGGRWLAAAVVATAALAAGCSNDKAEDADKASETTAASIPLSEGFCGAAEPVFDLILADSPDDLRSFYEQLPEVREVLVDEAPEELADHVNDFLAGVDAAQPAFEKADYDPSKLDAAEIDGFDDGKVQESGGAIAEYVDVTCLGNEPSAAEPADPAGEPGQDGAPEAEQGNEGQSGEDGQSGDVVTGNPGDGGDDTPTTEP